MRTGSRAGRIGPFDRRLTWIYLIVIISTTIGLAVVYLLNLFTPVPFFREIFWPFRLGGEGANLSFLLRPAAVYLFLCACSVVIVRLLLRPLTTYLSLLDEGRRPEDELALRAGRRLINLPLLTAAITLGFWALNPVLGALALNLLGLTDLHTATLLAARAVMVGLVASSISFFVLENYTQRELIPLLFPQGRLTRVQGAVRIPTHHRIHLLYTAGTLVPLIILVATLFTLQSEVAPLTTSAGEYGRLIIYFVLALSVFSLISALRLNTLIAHGVHRRLDQMLEVVGRVAKGDFRPRVRVVTNDELGRLGDAMNEMIAGLAERERLRTEFGRYLTPQLRDRILTGQIPLAGERREATVMFADLRSFTPYVESHRPEVVMADLRAYFTAMHRAIRKHEGLVLQFVGDGIEAVFGVPLPANDHADRAVKAALEMRRNLERLNARRLDRGERVFAHGIGIHTGSVLAGNSGSEEQLAYSLIGSTVNLASRIQDLTKTFGCDILLSRQTRDRLKGNHSLEEQPPCPVKGYSKEVVVYKIVG